MSWRQVFFVRSCERKPKGRQRETQRTPSASLRRCARQARGSSWRGELSRAALASGSFGGVPALTTHTFGTKAKEPILGLGSVPHLGNIRKGSESTDHGKCINAPFARGSIGSPTRSMFALGRNGKRGGVYHSCVLGIFYDVVTDLIWPPQGQLLGLPFQSSHGLGKTLSHG